MNKRLYLFMAYLSILFLFVIWAIIDYTVMRRIAEYQVAMWVLQPIMIMLVVAVVWALARGFERKDAVLILMVYIMSIFIFLWFCIEDWFFFVLTPATMPALDAPIGWMSWGILFGGFNGAWFRVSAFIGFTTVTIMWAWLIIFMGKEKDYYCEPQYRI